MRLAAVSFLAALVAAPLAASAPQAPARYQAMLTGRIVESYSYSQSRTEPECQISRLGSVRRHIVIRSLQATPVAVAATGGRASYRPAALGRIRVTDSLGEGSWFETRRCRGGPIERTSGSCAARNGQSRVIRAAFRWAGPNRISFRPRPAQQVTLCGLSRAVKTDAWLNLAPGRVDEEALLSGSLRRVLARASSSRNGNIVEEQNLTVGQDATIRWTLTFRRAR
jgi:hypothetical protein